MKDKQLFIIWGGAYLVCAALGFIPQPQGIGKAMMVLASALFFVPGGILLARAVKKGNTGMLKRFRNLSLIWLGVTLALLVANLLSARAPQWLGNVLHGLLVILSSPMVCSQYWAAVMFGWACLLMVSLRHLRRK